MEGEVDLESLPEALPDRLDEEKYVIATYYIVMEREWNANKVAQVAAIEQSTGTWVPVPGETPKARKEHVAKVVGVYEVPFYEFEIPKEIEERSYIVQIAFPHVNFGLWFPIC